jgi:phosphotransferase system HPr (HPr) family protein
MSTMLFTEARCRFQVMQDYGLHLRLASRFARLASLFESDVVVTSRDGIANGKSTLDLLSLSASGGDWLDLEARGTDADVAVAALSELIASWYSNE